MVMPTSHQPPCCSLQPDYTTPSLNPEVNRFVLSKKYLPPIVLGILEQSYKSLHHLRTPECLPYSRRKMLAPQLSLGILGKFHQPQLQILLYPTTSNSPTSSRI
ncbi:hypothetical protein QL285_017474 [Trifolium repens]|nr:hypothetical protein QL285_017474 [Trifolium repens]